MTNDRWLIRNAVGTGLTKPACHARVAEAIKRGLLIRPDLCEQCGRKSKRIRAHHDDYDKPLDVRWLCDSCHAKEHDLATPRMLRHPATGINQGHADRRLSGC